VKAGQSSNQINYSLRGQTVDAFSSSRPSVLPYVNEVQIGGTGASSLATSRIESRAGFGIVERSTLPGQSASTAWGSSNALSAALPVQPAAAAAGSERVVDYSASFAVPVPQREAAPRPLGAAGAAVLQPTQSQPVLVLRGGINAGRAGRAALASAGGARPAANAGAGQPGPSTAWG
jgi:hypothetical protein